MRLSTRLRLALLLGVVLLGLGIVALGVSAAPRRSQLERQLSRRALVISAAGAAHGGQLRGRAGAQAMALSFGANRAGVPNRLVVNLSSDGRPLEGARVTVSFSMPSMDMWQAYTAHLPAAGRGAYAALVPVLGMPGAWQLRITAAAPGRAPVCFVVTERLAG